jgi:hypothetical protein
MNIEMTRSFFLWCTVINYGLLLVWALLFRLAHDGMLRLWGKWVRVSVEQYDILNVAGITLYVTVHSPNLSYSNFVVSLS